MQHKYLLRFIRDEMQRQKIAFETNEAFFRLFMPDEPWEAYRSSMSNWLSSPEDGAIRKRRFIAAVNEKLGLSPEVWLSGDATQKEAVVKGVRFFKENIEQSRAIFAWLKEERMSEEEQAFVAFAETNDTQCVIQEAKRLSGSFAKRSRTQPFLIALLEVMYEKGAYDFIYTEIFPCLLDTYDNSIKAKKAHVYASLSTPMYREAFDILISIKADTPEETAALQTSAISNIRRERFSSQSLTKEALKGLLETMIQCYGRLYRPASPQGYYAGINLAYMLALQSAIFPETHGKQTRVHIEQIADELSAAMARAKAVEDPQERYYAAMSELEFALLRSKPTSYQEFEYLLEALKPSRHLIERTRRQMGTFFVDIIDRFAETPPENLDTFRGCLEIFDAYLLSRSEG